MTRSLFIVFAFVMGCGGAPSSRRDLLSNSSDLAPLEGGVGDQGADDASVDAFGSDGGMFDGALPDSGSSDLASSVDNGSSDQAPASDLAGSRDLASVRDLAAVDVRLADLVVADLASIDNGSTDLAAVDLASIDIASADGSSDGSSNDLASRDLTTGDLTSIDLAQVQYDVQVSLAGSPTSAIFVRSASNQPTVGVTLCANKQGVISNYFRFTHRGTASITGMPQARLYHNGGFLAAAFPDVNASTFTFSNVQFGIVQGTCETFQVNGDFGPNSTGTHILDLLDASAVGVAQNVSKGPFPLNPDKVVITIRASGVLTVQSGNLRQPTIVVGGGDLWQNLNEIKFCALYEKIWVSRSNVEVPNGFDFVAAAVAQNAFVLGTGILPGQKIARTDIDLQQNRIPVPMNGCITVQLWGKLPMVQPWSNTMGAPPSSGDEIKMGLTAGVTNGAWDANYAGMYNVRADGDVSFQPVYVPAPNGTLYNPSLNNVPGLTLRKTKITITKQVLANPTLLAGLDLDFARWQMSADSSGSASWKKFTVRLATALDAKSRLILSNFRLRRGNQDIAPGNLKITDCAGKDLIAGLWDTSQNPCNEVSIVVVNEEPVTGSGQVYSLHATTAGNLLAGDVLLVQVAHPGTKVVTGDYATIASKAPFVWSDLSDLPHGDLSHDWTDDFQIEDLTGIWVLVR